MLSTIATVDPEELRISGSGLERSRALVADGVGRGEIAGAVLLVARHDQVAQLECIGFRDVEAGAPMQPDTIFRIASMTKPIVSVATLMLVDAGKLGLEDPVAGYIPELGRVEVFGGMDEGRPTFTAPARSITIRDLLMHTSGISGSAPHPDLEARYDNLGDEQYDLAELMRRLEVQPLAHQPGADWVYGMSHDVLGRVIEVVAGQPLDAYLDAAVFGPLGMVDTGFWLRPDKIGRLARVYEPVDGRLELAERPYMDRSGRRPLLTEAAGSSRRLPTTCGSVGCCSAGASSTASACCGRPRLRT